MQRELAEQIEAEHVQWEHLETERQAAVNMAAENARAQKELEEEADRVEKQMLVKVRMLGKRLADKRAELDKARQRVKELEREVSKRERRIEVLGNLNKMNKQDTMLTAHSRALSFQSRMKQFNSDMTSVGGLNLKELGKRPSQGETAQERVRADHALAAAQPRSSRAPAASWLTCSE